MKRIFSFFSVTAIILSSSLNSCTHDTAKPLEVDWNRTATVKGVVLVNSDVSVITSEQMYTAADISANNFRVEIDYADLVTGASGTFFLPKNKITYDNTDGTFSMVVPVGTNGSLIEIYVTEFPGKLRKMAELEAKTYDVVWRAPSMDVFVMPGETNHNNNFLLDGNNRLHYSEVTQDGLSNNTAIIYGKILIYRDLTKPYSTDNCEPAESDAISKAHFNVEIPNFYFIEEQIGKYTVPSNQITYNNDGSFTIRVPLPMYSIYIMPVSIKINDFDGSLKQANGQIIEVKWKASTLTNISTTVYSDDNERIIPLEDIILRGNIGSHWESR